MILLKTWMLESCMSTAEILLNLSQKPRPHEPQLSYSIHCSSSNPLLRLVSVPTPAFPAIEQIVSKLIANSSKNWHSHNPSKSMLRVLQQSLDSAKAKVKVQDAQDSNHSSILCERSPTSSIPILLLDISRILHFH